MFRIHSYELNSSVPCDIKIYCSEVAIPAILGSRKGKGVDFAPNACDRLPTPNGAFRLASVSDHWQEAVPEALSVVWLIASLLPP